MLKLFIILMLIVCLVCCSVSALAESASSLPDLPDRLPLEYKKILKEGGTVRKIEYPSKDYYGDQKSYGS